MAGNAAHDEFVKNMDKLEKALAKPSAKGVSAAAFSPADLCKSYAKVKPLLEAVLPILGTIPVVSKIVPAIRLLMQIADSLCKTA